MKLNAKSLQGQLQQLGNYIAEGMADKGGAIVEANIINLAREHVISDVYDVYSPKLYVRTGGLWEEFDSMTVPLRGSNPKFEISVFSNRWEDDRYVSGIVETGEGYTYKGGDWELPRPFMENTRDELVNTKKHVDLVIEALGELGIKAYRG